MFVCLYIYFTYRVYTNTNLQLEAGVVNTSYIEKDVLKGCLYHGDIFNRIQIDSNHNCCLFVCLYTELFVYIQKLGDLKVFSMDVSALYPSIQKDMASKAILEAVKLSDLEWKNIDVTKLV